MKISQTRNYGLFAHDKHNRPITEGDDAKLLKLEQSMKKYGFLPFPILVRREGDVLRILDGQHRFDVAKKLGLPILYVETQRDDIVISECAASQIAWRLIDYIGCYSGQGKQEYDRIAVFSTDFGIPLGLAVGLLWGSVGTSAGAMAAMRAGTFRVKNYDYAARVARMAAAVHMIVPWGLHKNSVTAIARFCLVKGFDDDFFLRKVQTFPAKLTPCSTVENYSQMYEDLYNHSSSDRRRIALAFEARKVAAKRMNGGGNNKTQQAAGS